MVNHLERKEFPVKSLAFILLVAFSVQQAFPADFFDRKIEDASRIAKQAELDRRAEFLAKLDREAMPVPENIQAKMEPRVWKKLYVDDKWDFAKRFTVFDHSEGRLLEGTIVRFYEYRVDGASKSASGIGIKDKDGKVWRAWKDAIADEDSEYVKAVLEEMPKPKPKPKAAAKKSPR